MIQVVIVDDHPVVCNGLEAMLSVEDDMEVVATAPGATAAIAFFKKRSAGSAKDARVVVSDVHMPAGDGFELLSGLRNLDASVKVILLAGMPLKDEEERARTDGAAAYLPKSLDGRRLLSVIRRVASGADGFITDSFNANTGVLSEKELTVLRYASEGKTRDEIAIILGISSETVKTHLRSAMHKLDTTNTTASVARAFSLGLLRA